MNQDEIVRLVIFAVIASSLLAAFLTVLINNLFVGFREREKSRREILDRRVRPAEEYLVNLQGLFHKVLAVACDDSLPRGLKEDFEKQFFEFGANIAVIQSFKILADPSLDALVDDFPLLIQNFVIRVYKVIDSKTQENEARLEEERGALQSRITAIQARIDAYRLNGYKPVKMIKNQG